MPRTEEFSQRPVWADEATHRAANLQHLAMNLDRLLDDRKIAPSSRVRALARANALVRAYRSLDVDPEAGPCSCAEEIRDIASGLVEIFGHTVGSVVLSLELQPLLLAGEARRALVLAASELVVNALRHAFIGRQTGNIEICLYHDQAAQKEVLVVADDGVGLSNAEEPAGMGHSIICGLAQVLGGEVIWRSLLLGGTEVMLCFPTPQ
jgi:two-component sensor histidine kinase